MGKTASTQLVSPEFIDMSLNDHTSYVYDLSTVRKHGGPFEFNRFWGLNFWLFIDRYGAMRTPISPGSFAIYGITGSFALADPQRELTIVLITQTRVNQAKVFRSLINTVYAAIEK